MAKINPSSRAAKCAASELQIFLDFRLFMARSGRSLRRKNTAAF
jgi:hypothetical protein